MNQTEFIKKKTAEVNVTVSARMNYTKLRGRRYGNGNMLKTSSRL